MGGDTDRVKLKDRGNFMKFLLFSDIHHYPGVFTDNTWKAL